MRKTIAAGVVAAILAAAVLSMAAARPGLPGKVFVGRVIKVVPADPGRKAPAEITVADDTGRRMTFVLTGTSTLYDLRRAAITADRIAAGQRVSVRYKLVEGVVTAWSVRFLP